MLANTAKFNIFLSTFNFILCFIGAQVIYSIFLPFGSEVAVSSVTAPYRFFAFGISILVIVINMMRMPKLSPILSIFVIFWILFLFRMVFDLGLSVTNFTSDQILKQWQLTGQVVVAMLAIVTSYKKIDMKVSFYVIYAGINLILLLSFFVSNATIAMGETNARMDMNSALGSLQLGIFSGMGILMSIKLLNNKKLFFKALAAIFIIISLIVMLRTGSRGPLLSCFLILLFYFFSIMRKKILGFGVLLLGVLSVFIFQDVILEKIGEVSPVMYKRLSRTIDELDTSGRDLIYAETFQLFSESPVIGKQFYLEKDYGGGLRYTHNIIFDSLIALGIIGGIMIVLILFKCFTLSYKIINRRDPLYWIYLILLLNIMFSMTSSAFYNTPLLNMLIAFAFLHGSNKQIKIIKNN